MLRRRQAFPVVYDVRQSCILYPCGVLLIRDEFKNTKSTTNIQKRGVDCHLLEIL